MNVIFSILLVIAGIVALLIIIAFFMKKNHFVKCEIIINVPAQKVFDYVKFLKNQDNFNKHAMDAPDRHSETKGVDGTVGYIYSWSGNKNAGIGEKEIINIVEGKRVEMEIRFVKPMKTRATIIMETESLADNKTKLSWSNAGTLPSPLNIMIPYFEKTFAKDLNTSLTTLKGILEK